MPTYYVHGIHVSLTSDWPRFLELVSTNYMAFSSLEETEESLDVDVSLRIRRWFERPRPPPRPKGREEKWGTDIFSEGKLVRYSTESTGVEFREGPEATVRAWYLVDRRTRLANWYRKVSQWGVCQRLMRLALHLPIFHMLERRDMELFHAAALAKKGEALLIAGLNGSGKSSLCYSLLDQFDYMADNFVLWNGEEILGFPEAIRLPRVDHKMPIKTQVIYGKELVPVDRAKIALRAKPGALVVLTQGSETSLTPLSPQAAARRVSLIHDMTHEFPRNTYLGPISRPQDFSRLIDFTRSVQTFALTVSDTEEAKSYLQDLL